MNSNFFNQIAQLDFTGSLQLTIAKGVENNLIVLVSINNEQCGDKAKNLIPPLPLNGTPQEFDEEFFDKITAPIQKVSGLMADMENFQKQLDDAKKQTAMEKSKSDKEKKAQDAKDKKYRDAMAKADELEKDGKYREAWVKVPEPTEYPEKKEEIIKRRSELSAKFAPDLFGTPQEQEKPEPQQEGLYPKYPESEENDVYYEEDEQEY